MKIELTKVSDWKWAEKREIASLDDLVAIMREFDESIIVRLAFGSETESADLMVKIYDDYVE